MPHRDAPLEPAGEARLEFDVESEAYRRYFKPRRRRVRELTIVSVLGLTALAGGGAYLWSLDPPTGFAVPVPVGTFVLSSQPAGAEVLLDGVPAGRTPVALKLTPGDHTVVASAGGVSQRLTARVPQGATASQHVVLEAPSEAPAASRGGRAAAAPPSAARQPSRTPSRPDVAAAPPVTAPIVTAPLVGAPPAVAAGAPPAAATAPRTPSRDARPAAAAPVAPAQGFLAIDLPFPVQVFEDGALVGTTKPGERLPLSAGTHSLTLVSHDLGFRDLQTVTVAPGRATSVVVEQRHAPLSINALPWAEVFISGRSFGETPLANITLPIGTYQVTLRHPALGERVVPVTVRLNGPNRVAVDMRP